MISSVTHLIGQHPQWLRRGSGPLAYLKFSTPVSGKVGHDGKVLLFVFEAGERTPTLCIKTTRVRRDGEIIRRNYDHLNFLVAGVVGTPFSDLFASPLYLFDDQQLVFSVETIKPGVIFSAQAWAPDSVLEKYIAWQTHLAQYAKNVLGGMTLRESVAGRIKALGLKEREMKVLCRYGERLLVGSGDVLPGIVQHGDLSPNNVLVDGGNVYFVDYDCVSENLIAGFDIFSFLSKLKLPPSLFRLSLDKYLALYFRAIGVHVVASDGLLFGYYLEELCRKPYLTVGKDGGDLIAHFKTIAHIHD